MTDHDDEVRKHYAICPNYNMYVVALANAGDYYTHDDALAAARAHRAAVVEAAPELAALRARVAELEAVLTAVRDDAYVLGEDCREHAGPIGAFDECPHCDLARKIDAAIGGAP